MSTYGRHTNSCITLINVHRSDREVDKIKLMVALLRVTAVVIIELVLTNFATESKFPSNMLGSTLKA